MSGLLNLALIALRQLIKDSGFVHVDDIATVAKDYTLNSNNVERFVRERCVITGNDEHYIIVGIYGASTSGFVNRMVFIVKMIMY
jgi:hypothetical protein